jgi:serine/threonine protein kinase
VPDENIRRESLMGRSSSGAEDESVTPPDSDPGSEPTISSVRIDGTYSLPTRVDPDAPIHHGAVPTEQSRPAAHNHVALPIGYTLQEYTLEAVLGSGGFGITYRARDNTLQRTVAIKEYLPNDLAVRASGQTVCAKTESDTHGYRIGLDGFLAEARVLATFRHPNIVRVTRFFEANNTAYMVMEYERGEPLRDWIKENGPIDEEQLQQMFLPLLQGLEVVHKARVLHRDIKPANIYVREEDGSLVLLDFGAARYAGSGNSRSLTSIVTPGYAPFEQYHTHGAQGPWSDLYALGGVLYWIVTGGKPLEAPSRVRHDSMPSALSLARGRHSERFLRAIDWALSPDEADRPQSVAQFRAVLTGEAPLPAKIAAADAGPPAASKARTRLPLFLAGAGVAGMVLAGIVFYPSAQKPLAAAEAGIPPPLAAPLAEKIPGPSAAPKETPAPQGKKPERKPAAKPVAKDEAAGKAVADKAIPDKPRENVAVPNGTVILKVVPQGEIVVDGKKLGTSPPLTRLPLSAGVKHKIEIYGSGLPHYWTVELQPGEQREILADFERKY